jgi:hypothetical protein
MDRAVARDVALRVEREGVELIADVMPRPPAVCGLYVQGVLRSKMVYTLKWLNRL